jgi:hypothetical protein
MGQARQCVRVWSAKTLVTRRASLPRFLHVGGVISALLVDAVPAVGGLEAARLPHPDEETTGSQTRIMPITHTPQPPLTSTFTPHSA